jgi:hypothetical protein
MLFINIVVLQLSQGLIFVVLIKFSRIQIYSQNKVCFNTKFISDMLLEVCLGDWSVMSAKKNMNDVVGNLTQIWYFSWKCGEKNKKLFFATGLQQIRFGNKCVFFLFWSITMFIWHDYRYNKVQSLVFLIHLFFFCINLNFNWFDKEEEKKITDNPNKNDWCFQ